VVYRAHDEQLDRDVAIKVLPAGSFRNPTARARLLREARTASKLNHPHICTIHEVGEAEGQAYIAMELVEGQSLSARLAGGALPPEQVLRCGLQLADALAHAHQRGIIHRDLKCANVIITPEGRAKVLDFGLAKRLSGEELAEATTQTMDSLSGPGAVVGTLAYMAPEQLRGQPADARSDIWALGVVLYEMAGGVRPFKGDTGFELSSAILMQPPAPLPAEAPANLRAVVERCLEKEPARRYQQSEEVRSALEAVQSGAALPAWRPPKPSRRKLLLATAPAAAVALASALDVGGVRT
jgi:serine/threonine protein kinase